MAACRTLTLADHRPAPIGSVITGGRHRLWPRYVIHVFFLTVAPSVVVSPPSQTVRPGDRITLQCRGQGTQPITIQWSKVIGSLSPSARERDGTLEISPVTAADSGRYRCIAVNAGGRAEAYVDVVVSGRTYIYDLCLCFQWGRV